MTQKNLLIILNKKDPALKLESFVRKEHKQFSFLNKKVKSFYSQVYSLSKLNNANVVLVDEKENGMISTSFYPIPETCSSNLSQLFRGEVRLDYINNKCLLAKGY